MTPDTLTRRRDVIPVTVPADRADDLIAALRSAGHDARPTGERVTTDRGLDAEVEIRIVLRE